MVQRRPDTSRGNHFIVRINQGGESSAACNITFSSSHPSINETLASPSGRWRDTLKISAGLDFKVDQWGKLLVSDYRHVMGARVKN